MDLQDLISLSLLTAGALVAGWGLVRLLRRELLRARDSRRDDDGVREVAGSSGLGRAGGWAVGLVLLTVVLGLEGIERRGMSHVEVYIPNIELPRGISEPPPRTALPEVVWWHWHDEPHPPGYFVAMWGWTKAFGTSLTALRLPGVLFGGLAVGLMFLVGARLYGPAAGLVGAGLLALNGHHVYWMQNARMYEPSLAFGLLSVWLWIRLLERRRWSVWEAVAYVAATAAGAYLQVYFWPFLAGQMAYTLFVASRRRVHPVLGLQTLAVILGTPMWAHAVYRAYSQPQNATSLAFVQDFVNFGFLFQPDDWSLAPRDVAPGVEWLITGLAVVALGSFLARPRTRRWRPADPDEGFAPSLLLPVAAGFALIAVALGREAFRRQTLVMATGLVPLLAWAHLAVWYRIRSPGAGSDGRSPAPGGPDPVAVTLAVSLGLVLTLGLFVPFLVSRGMLILVPLLLLVLGAGLAELLRRSRPAGVLALAGLAVLGITSVLYFRAKPGPNDHRGLADAMTPRLLDDDRIFVPNRDWVTTPIYYHLPDRFDQLVAEGYAEATTHPDVDRVWVLRYSDIPTPPEMLDALASFRATDSVASLRSVAVLYERGGPGGGAP